MRVYVVVAFVALIALVMACGRSEPADTTATSAPAPSPTPPSTSAVDPRALMDAALGAFKGDVGGVRRMGLTGDPSYVPVLVEFLRFPWLLDSGAQTAVFAALARLIGQEFADLTPEQRDWDWWVEWVGRHPEAQPPDGFAAWKGGLFALLVDPEMGAFLYDGVKANIRLEEIVWGGVAKDGIPALTNPPNIGAKEATYLEPFDRVFGVSFGGEHRAYPLRILNPHEMANDVVGGVPFALAY